MVSTGEDIERLRRRARPRLALEQAAFEITGNPIFAWRAIGICMRNSLKLPKPIGDFLRLGVAGLIEALSTKDGVTEHQKITSVVDKLWLRRGKHPFNGFDEVQRGHRLRTMIEVSRPGQPWRYIGKHYSRSDVIALAKRAGIAPSKARDEIALANKIAERTAEILENRSRKTEKK
jgi:hypothetical protein